MSFQEWLDHIGTQNAARKLQVSNSALSMWYSLHRFPRPKQLEAILDASGDIIDVKGWLREFNEKSRARKEAA
ncbi:TPA: hypothetical protein ACX6S2_003469 [Photobacterium damselae]